MCKFANRENVYSMTKEKQNLEMYIHTVLAWCFAASRSFGLCANVHRTIWLWIVRWESIFAHWIVWNASISIKVCMFKINSKSQILHIFKNTFKHGLDGAMLFFFLIRGWETLRLMSRLKGFDFFTSLHTIIIFFHPLSLLMIILPMSRSKEKILTQLAQWLKM